MKLRESIVVVATVLCGLTSAVGAQVRGPYIQRGTPTEMTVVWLTSASEASAVCYGASPSSLTSRATGTSSTQHEVRITGLSPGTRYYYAAGTYATCPPATAGNANHYFETSPPTGATTPFRIWLLGDSGNASTAQANVRNQMLSYVGTNRPDLFVHLGDMAYNSGTTSEFTSRFFGYYASIIQNVPCWPVIGNHEGASSDSAAQTGPYYDAYVLPTDGRAGGLASGTEAYYSFDYGNVHFIALDSYESSRATSGAQLQWMAMDVAATSQPWIIAFFHHGPYTKGTHNSDTETEHIQMRTNALPILEANGVDLVWGGHSHIYERSYLVHGAYDTPTTAAGHIVDSGDGRLAGDGAYTADGTGAVFVTAGHGGQSVGSIGTHPLMFMSEVDYGSCIVDVNDGTLTLTNVRDDGVLSDNFTMQKPTGLVVLTPANGNQLEQGSSASITWTTTSATNVRIEVSIDGGTTFATVVASTPNDGAYAWTVPSTLTASGVIRISDTSNAASFDLSGTFSIVSSLPRVMIPYGATWEYFDTGVPSTNWMTTTGGWSSGAAELGYGDGDESTVLYDTDPNIPTVYFRRELVLDRHVSAASLKVLYDDGYAVYVNGVLVASENVANGTGHAAWASASSSDNAEETTSIDLTGNPFVVGSNVIAVLVKQASSSSSDLSFNLELTLTMDPATSVDECSLGTDDCDVHATCVDTAASFSCTCNAGYSGTGVVCSDVDECASNADDCLTPASTCTNTIGSFTCGCAVGYAGNGTTICMDVNECLTNNGGCSTSPLVTCTNADGGFSCGACPSGYSGDGMTCTDVNECLTNNGGCSTSPMVTCTNTAGGRICGSCPSGYAGDGVSCTDVNECLTNNGGCSTTPLVTCTNTAGGRICGSCPSGYSGDGVSCTDVNECLTNNGGCSTSPLVTCTNTAGGRICGSCPSGYSGDGMSCTDVNECLTNNGGCSTSPLVTCTNTAGGRTCGPCPTGYSGDGLACVNEDDCGPNPCLNGGSCVDGIASYSCSCPTGFTGDLCQTAVLGCSTNPCQNGSTCTSGAGGSYSCACVSGWEGANCDLPVDACVPTNPCANGGACASTGPGLFTCACSVGWSGANCDVDVDECAVANGGCDVNATCTNLPGSRTCSCTAGFAGDGSSCVNVDDCASNPCANGGTCIDGVASYACSCGVGFTGPTCGTNVDDCSPDPCLNGGVCIDGIATYGCSCPAGFTGVDCEIVVMGCGTMPCQNGGTCTDGSGGTYRCACAPGWMGANCDQPVDACASTNPCAHGSCTSTGPGTYACTCDGGWSGAQCDVDEDECSAAMSPCDPNATCINTLGSFSCGCNAGFVGNGVSCSDVDECTQAPEICGPGTCTNGPGAYACTCNPGYVSVGGTCVLTDACTAGTDTCDENAACAATTTSPGFSCSCISGYEGDGTTCVDVDECAFGTDACADHATCSNTAGGYDCACNPGYSGDGRSCSPVIIDAGDGDAGSIPEDAATDAAAGDGSYVPAPQQAGCSCGVAGANAENAWGTFALLPFIALGLLRRRCG